MKKIIIIPLLFIAITCYSATYYVAKTGNNSYTKTQAKNIATPWLTISYAESQMVAGDTCSIRVGTYNELVRIYGITGGTALDPTVFMNYNSEEVIIDGSGLSVGIGNALVRSSNDYTQFIGLTVINSDQSGIMLDFTSNNSKVINCIVHDCWQTGIYGYGNYSVIDGCTVYNCAMSNSDGIWQKESGEVWGGGISCRRTSADPAQYCIIKNCIVHDVWGEGVDMAFANYGTIEDNIIYDIYAPLLYTRNNQHMLIQRNLIYMTKTMGDGSSVGIGHWNEGTYTFTNNYNSIVNNIVYGCKRNFFHYAATEGLLVANNTFINSAYFACIQINDRSLMVDCEFRNNIIVEDNGLLPIYVESGAGLTFSNNLYNRAYDADAVGANDQISVAHIVGTANGDTYSDTAYYRLVSASPAIDGGYDLSGTFTDDYEGTERGATFDIGAIEYAVPNPPLDPQLADVETYRPKWASATTATTGGQVIDDGGDAVTDRGVCWNTAGNPTVADSHNHEGSGTGAFTSTMTGLTKGTVYYVRAFATNSVGTAYGPQMTFRRVYFFHGGKILTHGGKTLFID